MSLNGDSLLIEEVLKIVVIGEPNTGKVSKKKKKLTFMASNPNIKALWTFYFDIYLFLNIYFKIDDYTNT